MMTNSLRRVAIKTPRAATRNVHIERRLAELGYVLPTVAEPKGNYRTAVRTGNYIFTGACSYKSGRSLFSLWLCSIVCCVVTLVLTTICVCA